MFCILKCYVTAINVYICFDRFRYIALKSVFYFSVNSSLNMSSFVPSDDGIIINKTDLSSNDHFAPTFAQFSVNSNLLFSEQSVNLIDLDVKSHHFPLKSFLRDSSEFGEKFNRDVILIGEENEDASDIHVDDIAQRYLSYNMNAEKGRLVERLSSDSEDAVLRDNSQDNSSTWHSELEQYSIGDSSKNSTLFRNGGILEVSLGQSLPNGTSFNEKFSNFSLVDGHHFTPHSAPDVSLSSFSGTVTNPLNSLQIAFTDAAKECETACAEAVQVSFSSKSSSSSQPSSGQHSSNSSQIKWMDYLKQQLADSSSSSSNTGERLSKPEVWNMPSEWPDEEHSMFPNADHMSSVFKLSSRGDRLAVNSDHAVAAVQSDEQIVETAIQNNRVGSRESEFIDTTTTAATASTTSLTSSSSDNKSVHSLPQKVNGAPSTEFAFGDVSMFCFVLWYFSKVRPYSCMCSVLICLFLFLNVL